MDRSNGESLVRVEITDGIATIRLDRPPLNIINLAMQRQLHQAAVQAATDERVRAVVVCGGRNVFAAGADVKEMVDLSYADMLHRVGPMQAALTAVAAIPKPVVAAINGYALGGGCELALAADIRICADNAKLGQPEILLGIIPGAGGTQRLARLVGPARAKDLVFTGRTIEAEEALRIGLVDRLVPADSVYETAMTWAGLFRDGPSCALQSAKTAIDNAMDDDLERGLAFERRAFAELFDTQDRGIGMRSFIESGAGYAKFVGR